MAVDDISDEEFEKSIERHVLDVALLHDLPETAITTCLERYAEAGPHFRFAMNRAAAGEDSAAESGEGLFRAVHIMGAARDTQAFAPLLRFLRDRPEEADSLLGDAVSVTLPRILIGTFDGNSDALFEAIADQTLDELLRDTLLSAATFLTWEGRIDRRRMTAFLERFGSGELAVPGEIVWNAWMDSIALLGLRHFVPLVEAARAKDFIDDFAFDRRAFLARLDRAERAPSDASRFDEMDVGYLDEVLEALQLFANDEDEDAESGSHEPSMKVAPAGQPAVNPWRNVGRNDPCPCGSGKKAKRCCLAA